MSDEMLASVACGFAWDLVASQSWWEHDHRLRGHPWGPVSNSLDADECIDLWDTSCAKARPLLERMCDVWDPYIWSGGKKPE